MTRTLVAGFGNVLRGDDGFGVEVVRRLEERGMEPREAELMQVGTGGIRLAQELMSPCDFLIVVDAMTRGGAPGTLYVLDVDSVESAKEVDMHLAIPSRALSVAQALGVLPPRVVMVGCEPVEMDELTCDQTGELTEPVRAAVESAALRIEEMVRNSGLTGSAARHASALAAES